MIWDVHPGSWLRIFFPSRIPDPDSGVKQAPDTGSWIRIRNTDSIWQFIPSLPSVTLFTLRHFVKPFIVFCLATKFPPWAWNSHLSSSSGAERKNLPTFLINFASSATVRLKLFCSRGWRSYLFHVYKQEKTWPCGRPERFSTGIVRT
jgi:hypothetical protein